jgi:hypothetical protein
MSRCDITLNLCILRYYQILYQHCACAQVLVQLQQEGIPSPNTRPVSSAWSGLTTAAAGPGSSASNSASTTPRGRLPQQAQYSALQQLSASSSPLFSALARRLSPPPVLNANASNATTTAANTTTSTSANSNTTANSNSEEQQSPVANTAAAAAAAIVAQLSPRWRSLAAAARMPGFGRPQPLDIPTAFDTAAGVTVADSSASTASTTATAATAAVTADVDSETSASSSTAIKDSNTTSSNSADKSAHNSEQQQEVQELEVEIPRGHTAPPHGGVTGGSKQPGSPSASSPRMSAGMLYAMKCLYGIAIAGCYTLYTANSTASCNVHL